MHEGYVYHITAQVKVNPHQLQEADVMVVAHSLMEAAALWEAEILPKTVYHYHAITDMGTCLHETT